MISRSTRTRRLHAPDEQPVTFVELFFDLVFVFAITKITATTAHDLTWPTVARSALLFWLIWWAWTQFTWTLNPADTTHRLVRGVTLLATATAFVMSASVSQAWESDALWFAVPYVIVRSLGLWLQIAVDAERGVDDVRFVRRWAIASTPGLILVITGALVDPPLRNWIWLATIAADVTAAALGGRGKTWDLTPAHVSERHGLFVIIALGESLIVAGLAVSSDERSAPLVTAGLASVAVICLLWWTYFDWFKEHLEHALARAPRAELGRLTRDAFSLTHMPLVGGIIGVAVAVEEIMLHPEDPAPTKVLAALAGGVLLFLGSTVVAYYRAHGVLLVLRSVVAVATAAAVLSLPDTEPFVPLAVAAFGALVLALAERPPTSGAEPPGSHGSVTTGETVA